METLLKRLVHVLTENILHEASFQSRDIPGVFWLVTSVDEYSDENLEQISKGELEDIKGISANKMIVPHFFGVGRNAILVMPGKEVVEQNNLSRVLYDNPNYLLSNNMNALYRIWSKNPNEGWGRRGVMENILDYMKQATKPWNTKDPIGYLMTNYYAGYWRPAEEFQKSNVKINNIHDLTKFLYRSARNFNEEAIEQLKPNDLLDPALQTFERIARVYKSEGEWILKDKKLKIPKRSRLLIGLPKHPDKFTEEQMQLIKSGEKISEIAWDDARAMKAFRNILEIVDTYNLDKTYDIRWVDMRQFEAVQARLLSKDRY